MSESSAALRRLIKRNKKHEQKIERFERKTMTTNPSNESSSSGDEKFGSKGVRCKLPFVVAVYKPDPESISLTSKGRKYGLVHKGNYLQVISKEPIRCFDDKACLEYLLEKEDEREQYWREKAKASRTLQRAVAREALLEERGNEFETCLDELLEKVPMRKRNYHMPRY